MCGSLVDDAVVLKQDQGVILVQERAEHGGCGRAAAVNVECESAVPSCSDDACKELWGDGSWESDGALVQHDIVLRLMKRVRVQLSGCVCEK